MTTPEEKEFCEWEVGIRDDIECFLDIREVYSPPHKKTLDKYYGKPKFCPECGKPVKIKERG